MASWKANKTPKYKNKKTEYNGIVFDSKKEKDRYLLLKEAEEKGVIQNLTLQPKFELIPSIKETYIKKLKTKEKECERTVQLAITYTADFSYNKDGVKVIEDVKPSPKVLPKEFCLKLKLFRWKYGYNIKCVYKASKTI